MASDIPSDILKRFARQQRANPVQAETILWQTLRDRRCDNAKFRRQAAIGNFIVDFVCFEKRLIIEADGPSHAAREQQAKDRERGAWLREPGFQVLRLPNEFVIASIGIAVERIQAALRARPSRLAGERG